MEEIVDIFNNISVEEWSTILWHSFLYIAVGFISYRIILFILFRTLNKTLSLQSKLILKKLLAYTLFSIVLLYILREFQIDLRAILGVAGVLSIAIGVASKNSIGNIVSGLFLIGEKPFEIGDLIRIDETLGIVDSIDLLSIKLRTLDNLYIRIPNESIITKETTNITRYPIRRMDVTFNLDITTNIETVRNLIMDITHNEPLCLNEPEPLFLTKNLGDPGVSIIVGLWLEKSNYLQLRNRFMDTVHSAFAANGIVFSAQRIRILSQPDIDESP